MSTPPQIRSAAGALRTPGAAGRRADLRAAAGKGVKPSPRFLAGLVEALPNPLVVLDGDGVIQSANGACLRFLSDLGQERPVAGIGRRYLDLYAELCEPDSAEAALVADGLTALLCGDREAFACEIAVPAARLWFGVRAFRFAAEGESWVAVTHEDVTAHHLAEERLRAEQADLQERNREMTLLCELGQLLQLCSSSEEAFTTLVFFAGYLFPGDAGVVYAGDGPVGTFGTTPPASPSQSQEIVFDDCPALLRGRVHGGEEEPASCPCRGGGEGRLCIPLLARGEPRGVVQVHLGPLPATLSADARRRRAEARRRLAGTLAEQLALALTALDLRRELERQATQDPLTGLSNRRGLEQALARELGRAVRTGRPIGLILADLDHFKHFNDTYGHAAGDALLAGLGTLLRARTRVQDEACRYGGEEFIILLPDAPLTATARRAEELREEVRRLQVDHHGRRLGSLSVSLGVAVFPDHGRTAEELLQSADAALYRAKEEGRDRVVVAGAHGGGRRRRQGTSG
jgi:diguanylate cyclase (GGDEF)-like protein